MERRAIAIRGTVQGVGFRPFVYGLAAQCDLRGFVRNHTGGVCIEVEGETEPLDRFLAQLVSRAPPLAKIETLSWEHQMPVGEQHFRIEQSDPSAAGLVVVTPDVGTCDACQAEIFDPRDRRYRYPFTNCTNCGPRLTIVTGAPYDRALTTMAQFEMCPACRAEYEDPTDRRFHAQPIACPVCGPRLRAIDADGHTVEADDEIAWLADVLQRGNIAAIKGLGGYHLACDARNAAAVAELRRRKHRDEKPFAVMVRDLTAAESLCNVSVSERTLLTSPQRPIVLLEKRLTDEIAESIAPGNPFLGVMLPYTPLHHLLLHAVDGMPLVMTSGNRSDEPIAIDEAEALERLAGIADVFLVHNRPIHVRCDDSVTRICRVSTAHHPVANPAAEVGNAHPTESPIRRSRGYAPSPIPLPVTCPKPILAVGGQLKATFALGSEQRAVLSHHLGDLDDRRAYEAFERDITLFEQLFSHRPACLAHDMHPDYASTRYAIKRAQAERLRLVPVQHHHAHMASCMAEHGLTEPVVGVTFDGTGYGTDGAIWGGEILVGDLKTFRRASQLRYVGMPGGDRAIREPWRMGAAHLRDADVSCETFEKRIDRASLRAVRQMLERRFNTPLTSSAGRLFDAVASLAGVRDQVSYEGQAAIQLEQLATGMSPAPAYPFEIDDTGLVVDTRPMVRSIAAEAERGEKSGFISRRFHTTLVVMIREVCGRLRKTTAIDTVVLSGGVFMNALLTAEVSDRLSTDGFRVYRHQLVPPNDGGLSLGQVAVAAATLQDMPV